MFVTSTPLVADGSTPPVTYTGPVKGTVAAWGAFGGGTLVMQMSPDSGTTWINLDPTGSTAATFTANGVGNFQLNMPCQLRAVLSGATSPSVNISWNETV